MFKTFKEVERYLSTDSSEDEDEEQIQEAIDNGGIYDRT